MTAWTEGDVQVNDITIHYYRTGDKNKPSVLLLHGITDSGRCWSHNAVLAVVLRTTSFLLGR